MKTHRRPLRRAAALFAAASLVLVACQGGDPEEEPPPPTPPGDTSPEPGEPTPPDSGIPDDASVQEVLDRVGELSDDEHLARAVAGGTVVMYSTASEELTNEWQSLITTAYPDLQVEFVRFTLGDMLERLAAEADSGRPVASLYLIGGNGTRSLLDDERVARYVSPQFEFMDERLVEPDGYGAATHYSPMVVAWNTDRLPDGDVPITLPDLLASGLGTNPDEIGIATSIGTDWTAATLQHYGEDEGLALLEDLSELQWATFASNSGMMEVLAAGSIAYVAFTQLDNAEELRAAGAPVEWALSDPLHMGVSYLTVPADAPNPYGASFVYDWLLDADGGQQVLLPLSMPFGPRTDMEFEGPDPLSAEVAIPYSPGLLDDRERYVALFEELFVR